MTIKNNAAHLQLSAKVLLRFSGVIEHEDGFEASERKGEKCLFWVISHITCGSTGTQWHS